MKLGFTRRDRLGLEVAVSDLRGLAAEYHEAAQACQVGSPAWEQANAAAARVDDDANELEAELRALKSS